MERQGFISTIQKYSTKDGPGIRSTVFLMGCNLRCKWCSNPELFEKRVRVMHFAKRCIHCGACVRIAANQSIRFAAAGCVVDRDKCSNIRECADICPVDAYELIGYDITVSEIVRQLIRDQVFYEKSGGGVTFSGGEAALQSGFVAEVSERLRRHGIHTALDTAGALPWSQMEDVIKAVDLVLYDLKAFDEQVHTDCTGADNRHILTNAEKIAAMDKELIIRLIIVPDFNDNMADIKSRIHFIRDLGPAIKRVDILNYHNLGKGKYHRLGMEYPIAEDRKNSREFLKEIQAYAIENSLDACLEE